MIHIQCTSYVKKHASLKVRTTVRRVINSSEASWKFLFSDAKVVCLTDVG
jgi:hypothetical protein